VERPLVVGVGGTGRSGSTTERALAAAMLAASSAGASTQVFDGAFLSRLPLFQPHVASRCAAAVELLDAIVRADGVIVASPSYHGGVSALVKNALDYLEDLRSDRRPYLDGRAVGCIVTSAGAQSGGTTLCGLRSIVHALRGWPTPLGVTLVTSAPAAQYADQLSIMGRQVASFARLYSSQVVSR
jgi:FMN reductase